MRTDTPRLYVLRAVPLLVLPGILLLIRLSEGSIFPHLPGQKDTWNIQYLLPATAALLVMATLIFFRCEEQIGAIWHRVAIVWNLLFFVASIYATVTLWGEKY